MKLALVTDLRDNQLGRAHSVFLAAQVAGHSVIVLGHRAGPIWGPLRNDTEFISLCRVAIRDQDLLDHFRDVDVVIAIKPLPHTLGRCLRALRRCSVPLLVDIDDPDIEARTIWSRRNYIESNLYMLRHAFHVPGLLSLKRVARNSPSMVSNPVLKERYGGTIVPHARPDFGCGAAHTSNAPLVSFIGTAWGHKGIPTLRAAVGQLAGRGYRLLITSLPPADAQAWETWTGEVSSSEGMALLHNSDIVALPSEPWGYGRGQLPMKLVDAMLAARAVAVSDVGPLPWAVGATGTIFAPRSVPALVGALERLADPAVRTQEGRAARDRALQLYTPEAVAPSLNHALAEANGIVAQ